MEVILINKQSKKKICLIHDEMKKKNEMSIWYKFENLFEQSEHGNLSIKHWKTTICESAKAVWVGVEMKRGWR